MTEEQLESLIQKYADGTATDDDIQQLMHWYRTSPVRDVTWPATAKDEKEQLKARMLKRLQSELPQQRTPVIRFSWMRVAAAVLILITGIAVAYYFIQPESKSFITLTNPSGKIQMVKLPDSSIVWLNAATTVSYNKAFNKYREIKLDGEAFFEVMPNPSHPFSVEAGGTKTLVLGTSFNVKAYKDDNDLRVSVLTGKVKVESDDKQLAVLTPAQELQFNKANRSTKIATADTSNIIAWQKGELRFHGQSLADIAATLERWYGVDIRFEDPGIANCRYFMSFDNTISLEKLLSAMAEIRDLRYKTDAQARIIYLSGNECL